MAELNCNNLSTVIYQLKALKTQFDAFHGAGDISSAKNVKIEMTKLIESSKELFDPANIFLSEIRKKEFWDQIRDKHYIKKYIGLVSTHPNDARKIFGNFERLVSHFPKIQSIKDSKEYESFMDKLVEDTEIRQRIDEIRTHDQYSMYAMLNSCFLNKYLKENQQIFISRLPETLRKYFGCFLKKGDITVPQAGKYLGLYQTSGTLTASEALEGSGNHKSGGTLKIQHLVNDDPDHLGGYPAAYKMSGGTLYIDKSDYDQIATDLSGGTVISSVDSAGFSSKGKRTVFYNNNIPISANDSWSFVYSLKEHRYLSTRNNRYEMTTENEAKDEKDIYRFKRDQTLIVVNDVNLVGPNPENGMDGGILVYRDVPESEIGKGMRGGAVIIENETLSAKDVVSRLSKDRPGGVILLRVNGKLIDLENSI